MTKSAMINSNCQLSRCRFSSQLVSQALLGSFIVVQFLVVIYLVSLVPKVFPGRMYANRHENCILPE